LTSPASASEPNSEPDAAASRAKQVLRRALIYGALLFWTFVCLFPIY